MTEYDKDIIERDVNKALAFADLLAGVDGNVIADTVVGAGMILTDILVGIKESLERNSDSYFRLNARNNPVEVIGRLCNYVKLHTAK